MPQNNKLYRFKILALLVFLFAINAQGIDSLRHHVVLLMDRSGSIANYNSPREIASIVQSELPRVLLKKNRINKKVLNNARPLMENGDYLSIVSFGFSKDSPDVRNYIEDKTLKGRSYGKKYSKKVSGQVFKKLLADINVNSKVFFRKNWTGLSFAGPLALSYLNIPNKPKDINRTFVVIVTDGEFNSISDPNSEADIFREKKFKNHNLILEKYNKVNESFLWKSIYKGGDRRKNKYKYEIFEYEPLQKTFAIESVLPFPQEIELKRTPKGYYTCEIDLKPYSKNRQNFKLEKIAMRIENPDTGAELLNESYQQIYNDTSIVLKLDKDFRKSDLELDANFWVYYDDGVYGTHVLHPGGSTLQGKEGLNRIVDLNFEPKAKVFGVLPLGGIPFRLFSFISNNQYSVASAINYMTMVLVGLLLLMYIWKKYNYKKLSNTDFENIKI